MKLHLALAPVVLAALACSTRPKTIDSPLDAHAKPPEQTSPYVHDITIFKDNVPWGDLAIKRLSLQRSGCFGSCPVYRVQFFRGGKATYKGVSYTQRKGTYEGEVGYYGYGLLCSLVERLNLMGMSDDYQAGWTDDETITIEIETKDGIKTIADYGRQAPPEFQAFRALFDELSERTMWRPVMKSK